LPDALDLIIVCIEAGSSLDQAIVKASDELEITHRPLAQENANDHHRDQAENHLEAFTNFAQRTKCPMSLLVTMLTQTDRFGTSISQALRIHAETSRTKRRQRAEGARQKSGVKLVFPGVMYLPRGLRRVHRLGGHCDLSRSVLVLVRLLVSVTRVGGCDEYECCPDGGSCGVRGHRASATESRGDDV
jgi:hypothetical protein